jgi:flagellar biogenesis protein FliO
LDTLFGEGQTGPKILLFLVVVLGLLAVAYWLLRRFGGGRLGSAAARGRQPRLALIDQATIDNRRRLCSSAATMWSISSSSADRPTS